MSYRDVLALVVKAQRSSITSGEQKKAWVVQQLSLLTELSPTDLSLLIDFLVDVLNDPTIQVAFRKGQRKCFKFCQ
jgi:hypothetical protein